MLSETQQHRSNLSSGHNSASGYFPISLKTPHCDVISWKRLILSMVIHQCLSSVCVGISATTSRYLLITSTSRLSLVDNLSRLVMCLNHMQQTHFTYNEASALTVNFNLTCFGLDFKNRMSRMIQQKPTDKRFCQSTPLVQKIAPQVLFE